MGIAVDWTINIGHILTFFGFIICGLGVVWALKGDVKLLTSRMINVENEMRRVTEILVTLGRQDVRLDAQDARLNSYERQLEDLRHGHGFILESFPRAMKS